jgi:cell division protein FtsB
MDMPSTLSSMRILLAVLIGLLLSINYMLWLSKNGGIRQVRLLEAAVQVQKVENHALEERNKALEAEIKSLKEGLKAIEERARAELGMIRKDETFFHILEEPLPRGTPQAMAPENTPLPIP